MALQTDDLLLVGRGEDMYKAPASQIKSFTNDGFTGAVTLQDGTVLIFENGLLTEVTP